MHYEKQKDRNPNTNTAHDHAGFDFVISLHFRRDTEVTLHLHFARFSHLARHKHVGHPGVAPIELLTFRRIECLSNRLQVSSARRAELYVVTLIRGTARTYHRSRSYSLVG